MKSFVAFGACLLIFPAVLEQGTLRDLLIRQLDEAGAPFFQGRYQAALDRFEAVRAAATRARDWKLAGRAETDAASCLFGLRQYQKALRGFLDARKLAISSQDFKNVAVLDADIASLHMEMKEYDSAAASLEAALGNLSANDRNQQEPRYRLLLGGVRLRQNRVVEAMAQFREAAEDADRIGDADLYATAWSRIGYELLTRNRPADAEPALLEAYRVRKLNHLRLIDSYQNLGTLRFEQGDFVSASYLLDRAVQLAQRPGGSDPDWELYETRGRLRLAQNRLSDALGDLRIAVRLASAWRRSAPSEDAVRVAAEGRIAQAYAALVAAGNRLYMQTGDPALLRETYEAAEENRASSLRALVHESRGAKLIPARLLGSAAPLSARRSGSRSFAGRRGGRSRQ